LCEQQTGSETDFEAIVERIKKNNDRSPENKDGKTSELTRLSDECLQLLLQARNEVFRLLQNDSYKRFIIKPDVQKHFREHRGILMAQNSSSRRGRSQGSMPVISEKPTRAGVRNVKNSRSLGDAKMSSVGQGTAESAKEP